MDRRINRPTPRALQVRRIRRKHGMSQRQAALLARHSFGEAST